MNAKKIKIHQQSGKKHMNKDANQGSSGAMERDAAVEMFTRSIEKHNLFYNIFAPLGQLLLQ